MSHGDEEGPLLSVEEESALLDQLEAAWRPGSLDPVTHERLLAIALEDPLAPATDEERAQSARLRDALDEGRAHADADVLRALAAPFATSEAAALERALAAAERSARRAPSRRNVVYVVFGAGSALAAAAAVLLVGGAPNHQPAATTPSPALPQLIAARSTAELFDGPFETGRTSARMDVIASARSRDLRDNRYAAWGVK